MQLPQFFIEQTPVYLGQDPWLIAVHALNLGAIFFLTVCGCTDLFYKKIFNKVTYPAMLAGIVLNTAASGLIGLQSSLLGLFMGFGIMFLAFMTGGIRGGDVKLMGGVGALLGYPFIFYALGFSFLFTFVSALYVMTMSGSLGRGLQNVARTSATYVMGMVYRGYQPTPLDPANSQTIRYGLGCIFGTMVAWFLIGGRYLAL